MFNAESDRADDAGFADLTKDGRHHFRFIVSPEDAAEMTDLRAFTRDLARQMEAVLGTKLDWIAVDHWNTDNPHVHLLEQRQPDWNQSGWQSCSLKHKLERADRLRSA